MRILIEDAYILTMDEGKFYDHGAVFVDNQRIIAVGPVDQIRRDYGQDAEDVITASGEILIPGLIDCHEHAGADRLAEVFNLEIDIMTLLKKYKWPLLTSVTPDQIRIGAELAYLESIRNGVTTTIMNYYAGRGINQDGVPETAKKLGVKTILARGYHDLPGSVPDGLIESEDEVYRAYEQLIEKWHYSEQGHIRVAISPVNLAFNTPSTLKQLSYLAKQHDIGFHTHLSEVESEVREFKARTGQTMVGLLDSIDALGPKTQAAQSIYLTDEETEHFKQQRYL